MNSYEKFVPLQNKLMEMLGDFDAFCRKYNIEYYIYGGTALGAARHGGFIPWDDDVDVVMTQNNFDRLKKIFLMYGDKERYYLQLFSRDTNESIFCKWRANGTTFIETASKDRDVHQGMFIDVFAIQEAPNDSVHRVLQYVAAKYLSIQEYASRLHVSKGIFLDIICWIVNQLPRFFLTTKALKYIKKYNGKNTKYYSKFTEGCRYKNGYYKQEILGKPKDVKFGDLTVMGPSKMNDFLVLTFGNWKEIPTDKEKNKKIHCEKYDTKKDFREYVTIKDFSDEQYL